MLRFLEIYTASKQKVAPKTVARRKTLLFALCVLLKLKLKSGCSVFFLYLAEYLLGPWLCVCCVRLLLLRWSLIFSQQLQNPEQNQKAPVLLFISY